MSQGGRDNLGCRERKRTINAVIDWANMENDRHVSTAQLDLPMSTPGSAESERKISSSTRIGIVFI